jgi:hypothetical protein
VGWFEGFLAGAGVFLLALGRWWEKEQRRKALESAQADADRISARPADEWLRRFKEQRVGSSPAANAGEPDSDR